MRVRVLAIATTSLCAREVFGSCGGSLRGRGSHSLVQLDKHRAIFDGRHALIQHRPEQLPAMAHAVQDYQFRGDTGCLHAFDDAD